MGREDTKIRVLAVAKILAEGQWVTAAEIKEKLDLRYDIQANRKAIYSDIYAIDRIFPVEVQVGRNGGYKKMDPNTSYGERG